MRGFFCPQFAVGEPLGRCQIGVREGPEFIGYYPVRDAIPRSQIKTIMTSNSTGPQSANGGNNTPMSSSAASRIQASQARANGGQIASGSFAARAMAAAARNASHQGGKSGGPRGR